MDESDKIKKTRKATNATTRCTTACRGVRACVGNVLHTAATVFAKGPLWRRILAWLTTMAVSFIVLLGLIDINFLWMFGKSPGFADIKHPVVSEASEVYSADGVLMGRYYNENRTPVKYEQISPILIRTLISTEDERFYHHHGVDFQGLFAAGKDMMKGNARGASTITQQLAKNLFRVRTRYSTGLCGHIPGLKLFVMKMKEWIVAEKLEFVYSKEDILTMYLNTVDFGSNAFGIKTAARIYFNTTPDSINYEQAATLVGLLKATSTYNPRLHPANALSRRAVVLDNLYEHNGIVINGKQATRQQLDSIKALPLALRNKETDNESQHGIAPYFRQELKKYIESLCNEELVKGYDSISPLDLDVDGVKIYTTIDTRIQKHAEEAVCKQMAIVQQRFDEHWGATPPWTDRQGRELPNSVENIARNNHTENLDSIRKMLRYLHCGFVAIEPDTREVKAWVGDIDYNRWKYDKVTAMRQPGSTFKLFAYTEAMNQGMKPTDYRTDRWMSYPDTTATGKATIYAPHNANGFFSGLDMPLRSAFAQSINSVAVKIGQEVGIPNIIRTAHAMGIESPLENVKSLPLGACDVNLLELVNAYCTVIADGRFAKPILITKIEDRNGRIIYEAKRESKQAIPYRSAFFMRKMLEAGLREAGGTSMALWQYIHPVLQHSEFGGKTGTSNNHSDAWFVGVTPKMVAGAWVGGEFRSIHFRTGQLGQGSRTALPVFGYFIQSLLKDDRLPQYREKFAQPKEPIREDEWMCKGVLAMHPDSLRNDSLRTDSALVQIQ